MIKKGLVVGILFGFAGILNAQTDKSAFEGFVNDVQFVNVITHGRPLVPQKAAAPKAEPLATYTIPEGYFFSGFSNDFRSLDGVAVLGGAGAPAQWKVISSGSVQSVNWNFNGQIFNEPNPTVTFPAGIYDFPILTANGNGSTSTYQLGITGKKNVLKLGGNNVWNVGSAILPNYKSFGVGNYDLSKSWGFQSDMKDVDLWDYIGEKELHVGKFKGIGNAFDKPAGDFVFDTLYVHCLDLVLKGSQPLTVNIYEESNNQVGRLIASATATQEDITLFKQNTLNCYTVSFSFGGQVDIKTAFFVEFTGYDSTAVLLQRDNHPVKNYAYMIFEDDRIPLSDIYNTNDGKAVKLSFLIDMNGVFPRNLGTSSVIVQDQVSVRQQGGHIELVYPADASSVAIYAITGQKVAEYALDKTGTSSLSTDRLGKGIYILKFKGINAAVKILCD